MRSPNNFSFAVNPSVSVPRSSFNRPRSLKTAFDAGYLVPFFTDEVYPGDTFNVSTNCVARLSTPIVPFMDNLYLDFFFFFVPYRLLWSHWVNFCGEQDNPDDSIDYLTPIVSKDENTEGIQSIAAGSLFDYLGFPVGDFSTGGGAIVFNAFLPRAYNKVYNDHFRDENLIDSVPENKDDGPDYESDYTLLRRGKRHDYFTSCLPWPQKGPGVEIALGGIAPVMFGNGYNGEASQAVVDITGTPSITDKPAYFSVTNTTGSYQAGGFCTVLPSSEGALELNKIKNGGASGGSRSASLYADLTNASAVTINSLREAFQIQRLLERSARGGTRYFEQLRSHFGVISPDARLQRSEYLGGGEVKMMVHSVAQTSSSDTTTPQGNLAGYGYAAGRVGFSKSFVEHGVLLGLVSARADLTYQQGIHRSWSRRTRYDYYWPSLAHLGEQAVLNKEIYATGDSDVDNAVFGYQERWSELRYGVSQITGKLRSTASASLDVWHLAQNFASLPTLNKTFIEDTPPLQRVLAVSGEPEIIFDSLTECNTVRCLPTYSIPGLIDHL